MRELSLVAFVNEPPETEEAEEAYQIEEYELVSSPNDFNISTIFSFIESGAVVIPGFQRNYVWDIKRASKLIESIILGLPIPQIFLYEEGRNKFLVIDGQQRLMSIYYFIKARFPRPEKRSELRRLFVEQGKFDDSILFDDRYFTKFDLVLPKLAPDRLNNFAGLNYQTLGDAKRVFDLRTIRNVIIKQISPRDDDSSIHEIFNRLNTGGVNLTPQEIRASLYHSKFYDMLAKVNLENKWRELLSISEPDIHMKDIEAILRSFAILMESSNYRAPMVRFLDGFSKLAKSFADEKVSYLERLFTSFLEELVEVPGDAFLGESKRFNISLFESVFYAVCKVPLCEHTLVTNKVDPDKVYELSQDSLFESASSTGTTNKSNVETRLRRARVIFGLEPDESAVSVLEQ